MLRRLQTPYSLLPCSLRIRNGISIDKATAVEEEDEICRLHNASLLADLDTIMIKYDYVYARPQLLANHQGETQFWRETA